MEDTVLSLELELLGIFRAFTAFYRTPAGSQGTLAPPPTLSHTMASEFPGNCFCLSPFASWHPQAAGITGKSLKTKPSQGCCLSTAV